MSSIFLYLFLFSSLIIKNNHNFFISCQTINLNNNNNSTNIEFTKFEFDSIPIDLAWCGIQNEVIIILTSKHSIYRSIDKGMHWSLLNDIFKNTGMNELEETSNEIGQISSIVQSSADKNLLIFLGSSGINWISENCGENIRALNHGRPIHEYVFHPTEREWALASAFTICDDFIEEPCKIYKEVFLTKDLGLHWVQLNKYVVQFSWGIVEKEQIDKGVPKERILMSYEPRGEGDQKLSKWNYKVDFICSDDFFNSTKLLVTKGNKFLLTNHYLFVATVVDQDTQEVLLLSSKSTHFEYDFKQIETNQKSFLEHSYTFLDSSFHSVFLHINHFGEASKYGHIYTSGPRGLQYSLSLKNNVRNDENQCDFEKINSVEGVYIANYISGKYMKMAQKEMEQYSNNKKNSIGKSIKKNINKNPGNKKNLFYKDYIKTVITFNKGGEWQRIKAPKYDSLGKEYECGEYCYLNLFGLSSENPPFYSVDNAIGIIISNGNVGHYLSRDIVNTYLSRDGGLNWFEIKKGSHIYEIGDNGGLILLADYEKPTNRIYYSWDEGLNFEDLIITNEEFLIRNIIIEPKSNSHNFIVYGENLKKGSKKGIIIGINFGKVFGPCKSNDFEIWSPSDGRAGTECLLGHKIEITRRKRDAKCIVNFSSIERKIIKTNCDCTIRDYQCDMGYQREDVGMPCTSLKNNMSVLIYNKSVSFVNSSEIRAPKNCYGKYYISKGYRKIPGDTCVKGIEFDPIEFKCPFFMNFGIGFVFIFFVVLIILVVGVVFVNKNYYVTVDFSVFVEIYNYIKSILNFKKNGKGEYDNINLDDDDNMLFEDDSKVINPTIEKK